MQTLGDFYEVTGTEQGTVVTFGWTAPDGVHQMTVTRTEAGADATHQMQAEDGIWQDAGALVYTPVTE